MCRLLGAKKCIHSKAITTTGMIHLVADCVEEGVRIKA